MRYIALFRGINVGGKNKVKMDDLKEMFENLGHKNIETYIQSGNVIFEAKESDETHIENELYEKELKDTIQIQFQQEFSFESKVILRSKRAFDDYYEKNPISKDAIRSAKEHDAKAEHMYAYFLSESPDLQTIEKLQATVAGDDILHIGKKELYVLFMESIRTSKLAIQLTKAFPEATVRNWNTTTKLYEMIGEILPWQK